MIVGGWPGIWRGLKQAAEKRSLKGEIALFSAFCLIPSALQAGFFSSLLD
jgi:hypothetical protein